MKSWIKNLSLLPLLLLLAACNGNSTTPDTTILTTSTDTVTVPETVEEPPVVTSPTPSPSPSPEVQVDLSQYHQKFIQHAVLLSPNWPNMVNADKLKILNHLAHAWRATMQDQDPAGMEYNVENVNRFFQFVRLAAGKDFLDALKKTAKLNEIAHLQLRAAIVEHKPALLGLFELHLVEMAQPSMKFKNHLLAVATIYGVKLEEVTAHPDVVKAHVATLISPIEAVFNVQIQANDPIPVRLTELYQATTLGIQGSSDQMSFLPMRLVPEDFSSEDNVERFQVGHNLYGAVFLLNNSFIPKNPAN